MRWAGNGSQVWDLRSQHCPLRSLSAQDPYRAQRNGRILMAPIFVWEQEEALYTKGPLKFEEPVLHVRRPLLLWQKFLSIQGNQFSDLLSGKFLPKCFFNRKRILCQQFHFLLEIYKYQKNLNVLKEIAKYHPNWPQFRIFAGSYFDKSLI